MRALLAAVLLLALPGEGRAQRGADAAQREVLQTRERIRAAVAAKDRAALEALYTDGFRHLRDSGRADLKPDRLDLLLKGEETIETAREEGVEVQLHGGTTAVVTGTSPVRDPATGKASRFRWLAVYVKEGDRWRLAVSQASRARR